MSAHTITRGQQYVADLSAVGVGAGVPPDFSTTDITYVLDSPGRRDVFRWRPGGTSDSQFSHDVPNAVLVFTLTSAWTAANLALGNATLDAMQGEPGVNQDPIGTTDIIIVDLLLGSAPVTDPGP